MSGSTTLNLDALNGFILTSDEVGVVNSGAGTDGHMLSPLHSGSKWIVSPNSIARAPDSSLFGSGNNSAPQGGKATDNASIQVQTGSHFNSPSKGGINWVVRLSTNGGLFTGSHLLVVLGWNANSILLEDNFTGLPGDQFFEISDQPIDTTAKQVFGHNSASLPTFGSGSTAIHLQVVVCFAAGTRIATPAGAVAVEDLAEGDLVHTVSGTAQPVRWVGRRRFDCKRHPQPAQVMPVTIAANAFGPGLPARALTLSPEHAVFVDGALVPVRNLVNGTTIRQAAVEAITYCHIELPQHDVVLAEGLPAETYLDTGNRQALIRREARLSQAA